MSDFNWIERAKVIYYKCQHTYNFKVNKQFYDWLINLNLKANFFDSVLYWVAFELRNDMLNKDEDAVLVYEGYEGLGKSTLASQFCSIVSPTFKLMNICFEFKNFLLASKETTKGDSIQLDEGAMFLNSRERLKDNNIMVTKLFMVNRQDNKHYSICIPDFFDLDPYFRQHRVKYLIQITSKGRYKIIRKEGINIINMLGKQKKHKVKLPSNMFHTGYFNKTFPEINDITHESYTKLKRDCKDKFEANILKEIEASEDKSNKESLYISLTDFLNNVPLNRDTALKLLHKGEIKGRKVGNKWFVLREMLDFGVKDGV